MAKPDPTPHDAVCLFDLDGTLADYDTAMAEGMERLVSPAEIATRTTPLGAEPWWYGKARYLAERRTLIKNQVGFWRNLQRLEHGFHVLEVARGLGFENHALTKGPWNPRAWMEKVEWCQEHVPDLHVTIGQKKSLVYGKVLVDDWPPYFLPWLEVRPRGLVVAIKQRWNSDITHPNLVIYDGHNLGQVRERMFKARASAQKGPDGPAL
jgi:FMN phosphatase YigB (HAD superfamily)